MALAQFHTCARIFVHCCSNDTGGFPTDVASWTRKSCSFCAVLPTVECKRATAANHVDRESALNKPPHNSWPDDMVLTESKKITYSSFTEQRTCYSDLTHEWV